MATATTENPADVKALLTRAGMSQGTELTADESDRVLELIESKSTLQGDALRSAIIGKPVAAAKATGKKATATSKPKAPKAKESPADVAAGEKAFDVAASKGNPLSQRITPAQIEQARKALAKMEGATIPAKLGTSEAKLRKFVTGETATKDLDDAAKTCVKDLTKRIANHQVWARKAAAAALGIHLTDKAAK